jgi:regulator of nucleoside diphosphate kinase
MRDRIYITDADYARLRGLIARRRGGHPLDDEYLDILEQELDRAEVVDRDAIPRNVVTMNSEVRLKDLDSGETRVYRLIFPADTRTENSISVLAPVGTAMLGYRVGSVIKWRVPKGIRRLKVLEVISQPEAERVAGIDSGA